MTMTFSGNSPDGFKTRTDAGDAVITRDPAEIIYVDADAAGASDGTSWTDAYNSLQNALVDATGNDQIWIAEGTYYPDEGDNVTDGDETASFTITGNQDGLKIYGGFDGTESQIDERDISGHATILSGDIDNNDTKTNGVTMDADDISGNNSNNVLFLDAGDVYEGGNDVDPNITTNTELDGLIVTGGQANGSSFDRYGGGLYCDGYGTSNECSPTLRNVIFIGNEASLQGGAIYNEGGKSGASSPVLTNVLFKSNNANYGGAVVNGGNRSGISNPTITSVPLRTF
ncbi:hypothetical protein [Halalkalibaculum sp. DA3122]|uniref:hypothetical protein n=1 Tax=Halalkalibaculum sp. DA3122 TaxID=3373607 RepID=UPI0037552B2C